MEIKRLKQRKDGTKYIIVPKFAKMEAGDWVKIIKIEETDQ
jgi:hypothetical protein